MFLIPIYLRVLLVRSTFYILSYHDIIKFEYAVGRPILSSHYGYTQSGLAAYDVRCKGSEFRFEDCSIDKSPLSAVACRDSASNVAGAVCTYTRINPSNQSVTHTICNNIIFSLCSS